MKIRRISDPSYDRTVKYVSGTDAELAEWFKRVDPDQTWVRGHKGRYFPKNGIHYVVVLGRGPRLERIAILAHECLHLAIEVLNEIGVKHGPDSEEALAYYFDGMLLRCMRHL